MRRKNLLYNHGINSLNGINCNWNNATNMTRNFVTASPVLTNNTHGMINMHHNSNIVLKPDHNPSNPNRSRTGSIKIIKNYADLRSDI